MLHSVSKWNMGVSRWWWFTISMLNVVNVNYSFSVYLSLSLCLFEFLPADHDQHPRRVPAWRTLLRIVRIFNYKQLLFLTFHIYIPISRAAYISLATIYENIYRYISTCFYARNTRDSAKAPKDPSKIIAPVWSSS